MKNDGHLIKEKLLPEQKLSFENELTFAPRLNKNSRKIVSDSKRISILERSKVEKKLPDNKDLITKVTINNNNNKIATTYIGQQPNQKIVVSDSDIESPCMLTTSSKEFTEQIPNTHELTTEHTNMRKDYKLPRNIQSSIMGNKTPNSKKSDDTKVSSSRKSIELISISPRKKNKFFSDDHMNVTNRRKISERKHHRSLTFPLPIATHQQQHIDKLELLDQNHQRMVKAKRIADHAIKKKKIFLCNGPYQNIRHALRHRGWIEKNFKADSTLKRKQRKINETKTDNTELCNSLHESLDMENDDVIKNRKSEENLTNENQGNENSTNQNNTSDEFSCDDQYGIMSRVVRNSTPSLIWTLKRDDIDFRFLRKDQIVNHYISAWSFTTKAGLCLNLRNVRYFEDVNSLSFFPRCYRLCCSEERDDFIDDYRITAVQAILKILIVKYSEWEVVEKEFNEKMEADKQALKGKNLLTECENNSSNEVVNNKKYPKILSQNVLHLVLRACYTYLDSKEHKDIEENYSEFDHDITDMTWKTLIDYYYQIVRGESILSKAYQHVQECRNIIKKMEYYSPQIHIDGVRNLWILKPGAMSRGRGIEVKNRLDDILNVTCDSVHKVENRWVIQKYIEQPYLIYRTKFDIRQWFLVTDWNPLTLWFYKDCYIRFCSQEFTMDKFDAKFHLSNNSVQKHYKNGERSQHLPDSNMWSSDTFKIYLLKRGHKTCWDDIIYPGMKKAIILALQSCQDSLEYRKNSFELYGADFMLSSDLKPWLIEINSSPALGASTPVTEVLCNNVIEDTLKVVLDRKENKNADTGRFELAYRQQFIPSPSYLGCEIAVEGFTLRAPLPSQSRVKSKSSERLNVHEDTSSDSQIKDQSKSSNSENTLKENEILNSPELEGDHSKVSTSQLYGLYKRNDKNAQQSTHFPEIPIEKIKKRHSYSSGIIDELRGKLTSSNTSSDIKPIYGKFTRSNIVLENSISSQVKCNISTGYFSESTAIRKNFLDENIQRVQSKTNRTIKLKFKKPVKEITTKLRYNKQLGGQQLTGGENTSDSFSKYETSITKQLLLRH